MFEYLYWLSRSIADNSNGDLFASGLKPDENKLLRWEIAEDVSTNLWRYVHFTQRNTALAKYKSRIENAAFHDRVADVKGDPATPQAGAAVIIYDDKGTSTRNQRWAFEKIDTH